MMRDINRVFNSWTEILIKHVFPQGIWWCNKHVGIAVSVGGRSTNRYVVLWGIYVMNMLKLWLHSVLIKRQVIQHQPQWRLNYYLRNSFFVTPTDNPASHLPPGARLVSTRRPITPREPGRQLYSRAAPPGRPPSAFRWATQTIIYFTINWPDAVLMAH